MFWKCAQVGDWWKEWEVAGLAERAGPVCKPGVIRLYTVRRVRLVPHARKIGVFDAFPARLGGDFTSDWKKQQKRQ